MRLSGFSLFVLALAACDAPFVEPNPPVLERVTRVVEHAVIDEPVVFGVILDLNLPDPNECQIAQALVVDAARAQMGPGSEGVELGLRDLSPGCAQSGARRLDVSALLAEVATARSRFGDQRVRPVFFYANNVALPLSDGLREDLFALRSSGPSVDRPAALFGVASAQVLSEPFDNAVAWTFTGDPRLRPAILDAAHLMMPFRSRAAGQQVTLLEPDVLARAERILWCNPQDGVEPLGFTPGATSVIDPLAPPAARSLLPPMWLEWWQQVQPVSVELVLQVCTENCNRFVRDPNTGNYVRWNKLTVCAQPEVTE